MRSAVRLRIPAPDTTPEDGTAARVAFTAEYEFHGLVYGRDTFHGDRRDGQGVVGQSLQIGAFQERAEGPRYFFDALTQFRPICQTNGQVTPL